MNYDPDDYVVDLRRMGAGYAFAVMAVFGVLAADVFSSVMCSPVQA